METLYSGLVIFGIILLIIAATTSDNKFMFILIAVGGCLILAFDSKVNIVNEGKPASLSVLVTGKKYEVVDIYEKYIIVKSTADDGLKFIGPLDFGTVTIGRYVKTAEESLVKIE